MTLPDVDFGTDPLPDLHDILSRLRERYRVAHVRYDGGTAALILRHGDLAAAFKNDAAFPAEQAYQRFAMPAQGRTMQCMPAAEHRGHRELVAPWFSPASVAELAPDLLEPLATRLVERFAKRGEADLVAELARPFPFAVIVRLLGLPAADGATLARWAAGLLSHRLDAARAVAARDAFTRYLAPVLAERRAHPGTHPANDWLSRLGAAEIDGEPLDDESIYSFVRLLFPAGSDTTFLALGNLLHAVVAHPELHDRLRGDPEARRRAVDESLRLDPAVALQPRIAGPGARVGDSDIAEGEWVLFGIASANRDPEVFDAPDEFQLDRVRDRARGSGSALAFGAGTHFCLGSHLAHAELEVALDVVLRLLPGLRLAPDAEVTARGAIFRGPRKLPVRFDA